MSVHVDVSIALPFFDIHQIPLPLVNVRFTVLSYIVAILAIAMHSVKSS